MKMFGFSLLVVISLVCCQSNEHKPDAGNADDSLSTDSLKNPSYNPVSESDSAAKNMNLDSTNLKNSGRQ